MTDKIADTIAKLLAKAESTTPEEAEALTEKAEQLMVKYNLDQAMIDERRRTHGQVSEKIITERLLATGRWAMPMRHMFNRVVHATDGVQSYYTTTGGRNGEAYVYLVGYESQVRQVKLLIESLQIQSLVAMRKFSKEHPSREWLTGSEMWRECKGFLEGYGVGVRMRLERAKKTVQTAPGTEIMLARDARVKVWINENVGELHDGRNSTATASVYAQRTGHAEGLKANTGERELNHTKAVTS